MWISGHHHHELVSQRRSIWLIFINQPLIWKLFTPIAKHVGLWHLHQSEDRLATHGCSKWWREVHRSSWVVRSPVGGWIPNDGPTKHGWFRRWFQLFFRWPFRSVIFHDSTLMVENLEFLESMDPWNSMELHSFGVCPSWNHHNLRQDPPALKSCKFSCLSSVSSLYVWILMRTRTFWTCRFLTLLFFFSSFLPKLAKMQREQVLWYDLGWKTTWEKWLGMHSEAQLSNFLLRTI